jgi:hypothetical protein
MKNIGILVKSYDALVNEWGGKSKSLILKNIARPNTCSLLDLNILLLAPSLKTTCHFKFDLSPAQQGILHAQPFPSPKQNLATQVIMLHSLALLVSAISRF